jgi:hypothetical protein
MGKLFSKEVMPSTPPTFNSKNKEYSHLKPVTIIMCLQAFEVLWMKSLFFSDTALHYWVSAARCFETAYWSHLQCSDVEFTGAINTQWCSATSPKSKDFSDNYYFFSYENF